MKKIFALLFFVFVSLFVLSACEFGTGGGETPGGETPKTTFTISFYNGEVLLEEKELNKGDEITFPSVSLEEGHYLDGWLDEDGKVFPLTEMPNYDVKLYAKVEEGFTYKFVDYDGTEISSGVGAAGSTVVVPNNPTREKDGNKIYEFAGWDKEVTTLNANVVYTATYNEKIVYTVTYDLDGGNWEYYSYEDVAKALLKDYNKFSGKSYTISTLPTGAWELINFHSFYFSGNNASKWSWLMNYLGVYGSSQNRPACKALGRSTSLDQFTALDENYKYSVSYELRAFIRGEQITSNASYPTANYADYDTQNGFWQYYQEVIDSSLVEYVDASKNRIMLETAYKQNYKFIGWYDNPEFSGNAVTSYTVTKDMTLYAKFEALEPVSEITINNEIVELSKFGSYALNWTVYPTDVTNKKVKIKSSDSSVLSVNASGVLTAYKEGTVTITITSAMTPSVSTTMTVEVYTPDHFAISYESESYVKIGDTIQLNAEYIKRNGNRGVITWESQTPSIATVNNGVVTGVSEGVATIRAIVDGNTEVYQDFVVTVFGDNLSSALQEVIKAHNSNTFIQYNLGIGSGTPAYYTDVIGSVSKIMYNEEFSTLDDYYAAQAKNHKNHSGLISKVEFVTVHYTGNMSATADAAANASYFANEQSTSIHYTTGNDGIYYVLDEKYIGHHAGDGTSVTFEWIPTGVAYDDCDLTKVNFSASNDFYFEINGKKTSVKLPETYDYRSSSSSPYRNTDHIYNSDGTISSQPDYAGTKFNGRTPESFFNSQGFAVKVVNGEYYMGTTWWCYTQVGEGRIGNKGGNNNSIGIESCVNKGSDLWYTWHKTAKLVADIMIRYDLSIERVVGHHFYTAKDCPQPMLENDMEIWYEFVEMVKSEHALMTTFKDLEFKFAVVGETSSVTDLCRVRQPLYSEIVTYQVTVTNPATNEVETITLATSIEGRYNK